MNAALQILSFQRPSRSDLKKKTKTKDLRNAVCQNLFSAYLKKNSLYE